MNLNYDSNVLPEPIGEIGEDYYLPTPIATQATAGEQFNLNYDANISPEANSDVGEVYTLPPARPIALARFAQDRVFKNGVSFENVKKIIISWKIPKNVKFFQKFFFWKFPNFHENM